MWSIHLFLNCLGGKMPSANNVENTAVTLDQYLKRSKSFQNMFCRRRPAFLQQVKEIKVKTFENFVLKSFFDFIFNLESSFVSDYERKWLYKKTKTKTKKPSSVTASLTVTRLFFGQFSCPQAKGGDCNTGKLIHLSLLCAISPTVVTKETKIRD